MMVMKRMMMKWWWWWWPGELSKKRSRRPIEGQGRWDRGGGEEEEEEMAMMKWLAALPTI
jgi:hypothetical protein